MSNTDILAQVVRRARSREGKNQYTQGVRRTQVAGGYSDCSSFVRWCYLSGAGVDIGLNTAAQVLNTRLRSVHEGGSAPMASLLQPGDLLYFRGTDQSRPLGVGHVEMYIGGGQLIGHGSGIGPTVKELPSYCASRAKSGRGYIKTLRLLECADAVTPAEPAIVSADPAKHPVKPFARVTGALVNLRLGPGTEHEAVAVAKQGELLPLFDLSGWRAVEHQGRLLFISEALTEEVRA